MAKSKDLKLTPAKQWRKLREEGELYELPFSGHVARLRSVALDTMLLKGEIPNQLKAVTAEILWAASDDVQSQDIEQLVETAQAGMELLEWVCKACFVEPKVVDGPETALADDEISIEDIELGDKNAVLHFALAPTSALRRFREEQGGALGPVPDGENGEPATK